MEIIPTLFAFDEKTFLEKIEKLKFSKKIHIDFMDGIFVKKKSCDFKFIENVFKKKKFELEVHFMAYNSEKYIDFLKKINVKKVLIHFEAFENNLNLKNCFEKFKKNNFEVFLVVKPNTHFENYLPIVSIFDGVMFMTVEPGLEKQKFIFDVLKSVEKIKLLNPKTKVQVDGGVNEKTILKIKKFGVNIVCVGSFITSNYNSEKSFKELINISG